MQTLGSDPPRMAGLACGPCQDALPSEQLPPSAYCATLRVVFEQWGFTFGFRPNATIRRSRYFTDSGPLGTAHNRHYRADHPRHRRRSWSGSIRGTLAVTDGMGAFEGRFSGHYRDGIGKQKDLRLVPVGTPASFPRWNSEVLILECPMLDRSARRCRRSVLGHRGHQSSRESCLRPPIGRTSSGSESIWPG
jgi:hypothetical protein